MRGLVLTGLLVAMVGVSLPASAATASNARAGFIKSCQTQMYMSAAACSCLADKAEQRLDATAIAYLSLPALDVTHSAAMAKSMTGAERNAIDAFMKKAPHECEAAK
jgi:hypothetical protein